MKLTFGLREARISRRNHRSEQPAANNFCMSRRCRYITSSRLALPAALDSGLGQSVLWQPWCRLPGSHDLPPRCRLPRRHDPSPSWRHDRVFLRSRPTDTTGVLRNGSADIVLGLLRPAHRGLCKARRDPQAAQNDKHTGFSGHVSHLRQKLTPRLSKARSTRVSLRATRTDMAPIASRVISLWQPDVERETHA